MLSNIGNCDTIQIRKVREQKAAYSPLCDMEEEKRYAPAICNQLIKDSQDDFQANYTF